MQSNKTQQWPQCVGLDGNSAAEIIKADDPEIHTQIIKPGGIATRDYRINRVFIYVDSDNKVKTVPGRG